MFKNRRQMQGESLLERQKERTYRILFGPFGAMRSRTDSAAVGAGSLNQGNYVSVTLGLRANNPMVARL